VKSLIIVTIALVGAGVALLVQTNRLNSASRAKAALLARVESAEREAAATKSDLAKAIHAAENDPRNAEIARLRAELSALRRQHAETVAETGRLREAARGAGPRPTAPEEEEAPDPEREAAKTIGIAKLNYGKHWALAFVLYAQEHGGRVPATLEEAAAFFGRPDTNHLTSTLFDPASLSFTVTTGAADAPTTTVIRPDQYEITYQGLLDEVANPAMTIILREKEPFQALRRPGLARTYVFADGHSEIHLAPDGDFTAWERERLVGGAR
jgi:hypothetical protein